MKLLFARKSVHDLIRLSGEASPLHRALGPWNLVALGIGSIIGAGIFVMTGQVAAEHSGPAIVLSFVLAAFSSALAGMCYAELASLVPVSGSAYTYAYATLGEVVAWIMGWDLILEYLFAGSTVAVGWSGYVVSFLRDFGILIPVSLSSSPFNVVDGKWILTGAYGNLPAMLVVFLMSALLVVGIRKSASFNNGIVILKLAVIVLFIGAGIFFVNSNNWVPFIPENTGEFGHFGISGVLRGAGVIFFAYIGFDSVSTTAQEAKNPQRDMSIGILGSLLISTVLYIGVAFVLTGVVRYDRLGVPDPIALGVDAMGPSLFWFRPLVKIGAVAGLSSVILVLLLGQSRIFFSMAHDGLLPTAFSRVHPQFKTPYISTMITGFAGVLVAGMLPIGVLGELVSIGTLLAFVIVSFGVIFLRYTHPDLKRPFRVPWVPFIPLLSVVAAFVQMASLPTDTWLRLILWLFVGMLIYFSYGIRHSHLRKSHGSHGAGSP